MTDCAISSCGAVIPLGADLPLCARHLSLWRAANLPRRRLEGWIEDQESTRVIADPSPPPAKGTPAAPCELPWCVLQEGHRGYHRRRKGAKPWGGPGAADAARQCNGLLPANFPNPEPDPAWIEVVAGVPAAPAPPVSALEERLIDRLLLMTDWRALDLATKRRIVEVFLAD